MGNATCRVTATYHIIVVVVGGLIHGIVYDGLGGMMRGIYKVYRKCHDKGKPGDKFNNILLLGQCKYMSYYSNFKI